MVQSTEVSPGRLFSNGKRVVQVMPNAGLKAGLRLDQHPPNGLVFAPWFATAQDLADFLSVGGHVSDMPFLAI